MDQVQAFLEQIGQLGDNDDLVRGILMVGATAITALIGGWRLIRGKKTTEEITAVIKAPAGTRIRFDSGDETDNTK